MPHFKLCALSRNFKLPFKGTLTSSRRSIDLTKFCDSSPPPGLPTALRNLYANMANTTESVTPSAFLAALRHAFPQFAEQSRATGMKALMGGGYAQQGMCAL